MKKLIAVICAVVMMLSVSVPALANGSIGSLTQSLVSAEALVPIPEGWRVEIQEAHPNRYKDADLAEVVAQANDPEAAITVKEAFDKLFDNSSSATTLNGDGTVTFKAQDGSEKTLDLNEYDFISEFADAVLTDGVESVFRWEGQIIPAKVTMDVDALQGEDDVSDCAFMLVDPESGEVYFMDLPADAFDADNGEITVNFPCLGAFTLLQK